MWQHLGRRVGAAVATGQGASFGGAQWMVWVGQGHLFLPPYPPLSPSSDGSNSIELPQLLVLGQVTGRAQGPAGTAEASWWETSQLAAELL